MAADVGAGLVSRRDFVNASVAVAAVNIWIRIGFIGPGDRGFGVHLKTLARLRSTGVPSDLVAVSEVYKNQKDTVCNSIKE